MDNFINSKSQNLIRHQMQALNHAKMQPNFAQQQAFLQQQILIQKLAMQNLQQVNSNMFLICSCDNVFV